MTDTKQSTLREYSAGGVIYKETSSGKQWLVSQHSQHKGWVFPKGLIGDHIEGESKENTAVREVKEETGADAKIIKELPRPVKYYYTWEGKKKLKTVYYYLMEYLGGDLTQHDWEMIAVEWLSADEVFKRLSYKTDIDAFEQALALVKELNRPL